MCYLELFVSILQHILAEVYAAVRTLTHYLNGSVLTNMPCTCYHLVALYCQLTEIKLVLIVLIKLLLFSTPCIMAFDKSMNDNDT